jgi:hypothetical protein
MINNYKYQVFAEWDGGDAEAADQGERATDRDQPGVAVVGMDLCAAPDHLVGSRLLEIHSRAHYATVESAIMSACRVVSCAVVRVRPRMKVK